MKSGDLLDQARHLLNRSPKKPKQADLKRAISGAYYALFHQFCETFADQLVGREYVGVKSDIYVKVYRKLNHATAKKACEKRSIIQGIHPDLLVPARTFVALQEMRHSADYDPAYRALKSSVASAIQESSDAVQALRAVDERSKRLLAIYLLFDTKLFEA